MSPFTAKAIAVLFSVFMLLNAWVIRRIVGTWLFPGVIFALTWFAYTFLPLTVLWGFPVNPWSVVYLSAATLAFTLGGMFYFPWAQAFDLNRQKPPAADYFNTRFLRAAFLLTAALSFACFMVDMQTQGFSVADMLQRSVEIAAEYATRRYADELTPNLSRKLSIAFAYLSVSLGGLLYASAKSKAQSILALIGSFVPAIAQMMLESAKGLFFQFISLFLAGVLVVRVFDQRLFLVRIKDTRRAALSLVVVVPLTLASFLSRGLDITADGSFVANQLARYSTSYAFGHMYAFSDWFSFQQGEDATLPYTSEPTAFGYYTFVPAFKLLGSTRTLPPGTYEDYFETGDLIKTNIFTMYRGLINDFGLLGSLFFSFCSGFVIHLAFYHMLSGRFPTTSISVFVYSLGYFYSSAFISLFAYNVIPLSIGTFAVTLWLNNRVSASRRSASRSPPRQLVVEDA